MNTTQDLKKEKPCAVQVDKYLDRIRSSRRELSNKLGIDVSVFSWWQSGKSFPKFSTCRELLLMGMSIEELFGQDVENKVKEGIPTNITPDSLTPELCKQIVQIGLMGK